MKIKISLTLLTLLSLAMLLINLVLVMFWERQGVEQEAQFAETLVEFVGEQVPEERKRLLRALVDGRKVDCAGMRGSDAGSTLVWGQAWCTGERLTVLLDRAAMSTQSIRSVIGPVQALASGRRPGVVFAMPISSGEREESIGVALPLVSLSNALVRTEKVLLVYMGINLLVFGTIGFVRISNYVLRPVERLTRIAELYGADDPRLFTDHSGGGEFSRLAGSLNRMLVRIERDRSTLKKSIDELDLANRKLRQKQQEMIRAEKLASVGRLAAGLAHEIGNPVAIVQGYLGLLQQRENVNGAERKEYLSRAEHELERVSNLIRQLLDYARVSEYPQEAVSVHDLLESEKAMVMSLPLFRDIIVESSYSAAKDRVLGDKGQLQQVLLNCFVNAADAIASRSVTEEPGRIKISTQNRGVLDDSPEQEILIVSVWDNGVGIEPELLQKVYDPFFTTKEPGKGTGLGLAVSRSIVESLGGKMDIRNNVSGGATVEIVLPLVGEEGKAE